MKNFIKGMSIIVCLIGFGIIIGSAGSADLNLISLGQVVLQGIAGIAVILVGLFAYTLVESNEE